MEMLSPTTPLALPTFCPARVLRAPVRTAPPAHDIAESFLRPVPALVAHGGPDAVIASLKVRLAAMRANRKACVRRGLLNPRDSRTVEQVFAERAKAQRAQLQRNLAMAQFAQRVSRAFDNILTIVAEKAQRQAADTARLALEAAAVEAHVQTARATRKARVSASRARHSHTARFA